MIVLHFSKTLFKEANYFVKEVVVVTLGQNQSLDDRNDRNFTATGGQSFTCFLLLSQPQAYLILQGFTGGYRRFSALQVVVFLWK